MAKEIQRKQLYIVVSQTGTALSRILKIITRKEFNHASLSLEEDLRYMYSFGRKNPYNPFIGGFVKESASFGTFKRFPDTEVIVLKLDISEEKYREISSMIDAMFKRRKEYHYNYLGLWLAAFRICFKSDKRYYCSEFVKDILVRFNIDGANRLREIVHPMNFLDIPQAELVYRGKLTEYSPKHECTV
ncbi:MAG: hypothetical protein ACOYJS_05940 [Acutalibacteraceae bacterium]|jgi:hypothetical protein